MRLLSNWFSRTSVQETLFPKSFEDIQQILRQARDNVTAIRVTGGTFPFTPLPEDVVVDLRYIDRLIGLDIYQQTVTVESGMKISVLSRILETVSLSLDLCGRVPDLTICDAIAVGTFGANALLSSCLSTCEVILASGKVVTWTWEKDPNEMKALCCGLGMTAVVLSVTFKCIPLQRYTEISYLCSIRDVLDHWNMQMKSSFSQQLLWFPFSELTVMTHINPTDKYHMSKQPLLNYLLERVGEFCSRTIRRLSVFTSRSLPLVSSILSRVQFFTQWSVSKHRSDFVHSLPRPWAPGEACRGSSWLVPVEKLPEVICQVSQWTLANPKTCVAPLFAQTVRMERGKLKCKKPYLAPVSEEQSCLIWYDWFLPECDPDPIALAEFEGIFIELGGVRSWSGERLTSPLVLRDVFEKYPHWCRAKARLDPNNYLQSAYIQGTVWSETGRSVEFGSTLNLCSSVMDVE